MPTMTPRRFTFEELQMRSLDAQHRKRMWSGSYPYNECELCYGQIHVGGIYVCNECLLFESHHPETQ